jgi:hypothetical protein
MATVKFEELGLQPPQWRIALQFNSTAAGAAPYRAAKRQTVEPAAAAAVAMIALMPGCIVLAMLFAA